MRPLSLRTQLALLIFAAFVAAQVLSLWLFADERGAAVRAAQRIETAERALALSEVLSGTDPRARDALLSAASSPMVRFRLDAMPLVAESSLDLEALTEMLAGAGGRSEEVSVSPHDGAPAEPPAAFAWLHERMRRAGFAPVETRLSIPIEPDGWLNVAARFTPPGLQVPPVLIGTALLSLALILGALWLGLRRITGPLRELAAAAEDFGLETDPPAMPGGGPREVQALSEALGRMHERLSSMISDRTRMLAALGHDLRSPVTALRLRAEMVEDDETRERMVATLDEMQEMVEAALAYARGVSTEQPMEAVDLGEMLQKLADELAGAGAIAITAEAVTLSLRRSAMRRALRNLLENAQRYGGTVRVTLVREGGQARLTIDDDGPGIPEAELERVFEPFVRLETSRSRETGGTGLGLPIARAILRAHGGDVSLFNRSGGGLRATVILPMESEL